MPKQRQERCLPRARKDSAAELAARCRPPANTASSAAQLVCPTRQAFCEQADIAVATFGYWKRKLRDEGVVRSDEPVSPQGVALDDWIELAPPAAAAPGWRIELDLGNGICLRRG